MSLLPSKRSVVMSLLAPLGILAGVLCGCSATSEDGAAVTTPDNGTASATAWEGVVRAGSAEVIAPPTEAEPGDRLVQLRDVAGAVVVFSDRPTRREGEMPVDEFVALWHSGAFGSDPPNAAVLIDDQVLTVELTGAALDMAAGTLALTTRALDGSATGLPLGEHAEVTLFVDSFPTGVSSQVTDSITQTNVKVIGEAPAVAMGNLYQTVAASLAQQAEAATATQQADLSSPPVDAYLSTIDPAAQPYVPGSGTASGIGPASTDPPRWATGPTPTQAQVLGLTAQNWGL